MRLEDYPVTDSVDPNSCKSHAYKESIAERKESRKQWERNLGRLLKQQSNAERRRYRDSED